MSNRNDNDNNDGDQNDCDGDARYSPAPRHKSIPSTSPSLTVQESPFFACMKGLSPLKSDKAARYKERFSQADFSIPPPVFSSPQVDIHRQKSFLLRKEEGEALGGNIREEDHGNQFTPKPIPCGETELSLSSPSGFVDDFLDDVLKLQDITNTPDLLVRRRKEVPEFLSDESTEKAVGVNKPALLSSYQTGEFVESQALSHQGSGFCEAGQGYADSPPLVSGQETGSPLHGLCRQLVFGGATASKLTGDDSLALLDDLIDFECLEASPLLAEHSQRPEPLDQTWRTIPLEDTENVRELNLASPELIRKKAKHQTGGENSKSCNCKRSKCLKLYCECFAAGLYCSDSCTCEICINKPENVHKVVDAKQQIEIRNPLAFVPKVVGSATKSPAILGEEGTLTTPSSSRHKRGCNCKKSKCLKKYCECFQVGVGCSDVCRCLNCNNSFGKASESTNERIETRQIVVHEQPKQKLRNGLKVPSFPSLTPYSKFKDGASCIDGDQQS